MTASSSSCARPRRFPPTRWSVVLTAAREPSVKSAAALETLCRDYWYPLYAYARRCGQSAPDAQDLTQEFFRLLLERRYLAAADPAKGRLRTWLITAFKRFLAKEWRRASAQKRGGGQAHLPLDTGLAERRCAAEGAAPPGPDRAFDRQWALTLIELTLQHLQDELAAAGKSGDFAVLKESLTAERGAIDYRQVAAQLGVSAGAARVAVHRLRQRFRELYREELARTLSDDADLEAELRHLAAALV